MKKENLNLLLIIVVIMLPLITIFTISHLTNNMVKKLDTEYSTKLEEAENESEKMMESLVYGPAIGISFIGSIVLFFVAGLAIIVTFISLLMAILARAIIQNKKKKITYRVLMTLVYIPYTILEFLLLSFMLTNFSIILLIYNAIATTCLGVNFYNTYSKKMFAVEEVPTIEEQEEVTNQEKNEE